MPGTFQANDILFVDFYRLSLCEHSLIPQKRPTFFVRGSGKTEK